MAACTKQAGYTIGSTSTRYQYTKNIVLTQSGSEWLIELKDYPSASTSPLAPSGSTTTCSISITSAPIVIRQFQSDEIQFLDPDSSQQVASTETIHLSSNGSPDLHVAFDPTESNLKVMGGTDIIMQLEAGVKITHDSQANTILIEQMEDIV